MLLLQDLRSIRVKSAASVLRKRAPTASTPTTAARSARWRIGRSTRSRARRWRRRRRRRSWRRKRLGSRRSVRRRLRAPSLPLPEARQEVHLRQFATWFVEAQNPEWASIRKDRLFNWGRSQQQVRLPAGVLRVQQRLPLLESPERRPRQARRQQLRRPRQDASAREPVHGRREGRRSVHRLGINIGCKWLQERRREQDGGQESAGRDPYLRARSGDR